MKITVANALDRVPARRSVKCWGTAKIASRTFERAWTTDLAIALVHDRLHRLAQHLIEFLPGGFG
jgi:hypothetical protein